MRIIGRDDNLDLMDRHLTNGRSRSIPRMSSRSTCAAWCLAAMPAVRAGEAKLSRSEMDAWALRSHVKAREAAGRRAEEIVPVAGLVDDDLIMENATAERFAGAKLLFNDELVLVAGIASRWARRRKLSLADLAEARWVQTSPGSWGDGQQWQALH